MFPIVYKEIVEKMKKGNYGKQGVDFFEKYPYGAINAEKVIAQCIQCKELYTVPDLTMYIPKNYEEIEILKGISSHQYDDQYVTPNDLNKQYKKIAKYKHSCPNCQGELKIVKNLKSLKCPRCSEIMTLSGFGLWD